ncbi:hypothetical protein [Roseicyclus marinus]|uniref:hypothetical protein n=1 Tax=Roseicyclus marinus TaxID=2161673 RepID=UPI00240FAF13|nr:hypothetical protein [Roseicyclus marinus]MDG3039787.1 hypothetical protein [Roseicyclus marinus]
MTGSSIRIATRTAKRGATLCAPRPGRSVSAAALVAALALSTLPARADGYFIQTDLGPENQSLVATFAQGRLNYGLNVSAYDDGRAATISTTYALDLGGLATLKIGPALRFEQKEVGAEDLDLGLRLSLERYQPTDFGAVYGLAEIGSIDETWFLLGQMVLRDGFSFELSRGGSDSYTETTFAVQQQLGDGPVRLRLGYRAEDTEFFVGLSVNTF